MDFKLELLYSAVQFRTARAWQMTDKCSRLFPAAIINNLNIKNLSNATPSSDSQLNLVMAKSVLLANCG